MNLRFHDYFERGKKVKIIVNDETIEAYEGECLSVVLFISNKKNLRINKKIISHLKINVPTYKSNNLPNELKLIPVTKPGSRYIK